jgi:hypothetical protein
MFKKIKREIKKTRLEGSFIKKSEKSKFGGMTWGGVYRNKHTGKDYLLKRVLVSDSSSINKQIVSVRSWDEILAANFLKHAGVLVPDIQAVEDNEGWLYVASSMISDVKNCTQEIFKQLPESSKQQVYSSLMMHCWLGNRDLVNSSGENFIVDRNNHIYHVDLGAVLYSGFRSIVSGHDDINFNEYNLEPFFLESNNPRFGIMKNHQNGKIKARNLDMTNAFFAEFLADSQAQREYHIQGALKVARFSEEDIKHLVESTGHSAQNKEIRIKTLQARKIAIIQLIQKKYGEHALQEEQLALALQRIFHKQGLFKPFKPKKGTDAIVSFKTQFINALKPKVIINQNDTITIHINPIQGIEQTLKRLSQSKLKKIDDGYILTMPINELKQAMHKELIENSLQVFFASFGYKTSETGIFHQSVYKGDGHEGFRPQVHLEKNQLIFNLPFAEDAEEIKQELIQVFHFDPACVAVCEGFLYLQIKSVDEFAATIMDNVGVIKTAVISENREGKILAGKLNAQKKGQSGFATAGGNSAYPYNPKRAARKEGIEEFGYSIDEGSSLIPIGSTLTNKQKNIFLIASGGTSEEHDQPLDCHEFVEDTIQYYSFAEFRENYKKHKVQFDRSSIAIYLCHYEREIQKVLYLLGSENILFHISKSPATLGKMTLKPCIDKYDFSSGKLITIDEKYLNFICELIGRDQCALTKKSSNQGKTKNLQRECIEINEKLNPAQFYNRLLQKLNVINPEQVHAADPYTMLKMTLISKVKRYLNWRQDKNFDDGRNYPLGFFTKIRHYTEFGETRANNLMNHLHEAQNFNELMSAVKEHLTKDSTLHNHSLDAYILEGIEQYKEFLNIKESFNLREFTGRFSFRELLCENRYRAELNL